MSVVLISTFKNEHDKFATNINCNFRFYIAQVIPV